MSRDVTNPIPAMLGAHRSSADYIDRTIATIRNHRDADNCWPQWANILADEIEDLRAELVAQNEDHPDETVAA